MRRRFPQTLASSRARSAISKVEIKLGGDLHKLRLVLRHRQFGDVSERLLLQLCFWNSLVVTLKCGHLMAPLPKVGNGVMELGIGKKAASSG
jgi:hypothetical protein